MSEEPTVKFRGDPSEAIAAARKVTDSLNALIDKQTVLQQVLSRNHGTNKSKEELAALQRELTATTMRIQAMTQVNQEAKSRFDGMGNAVRGASGHVTRMAGAMGAMSAAAGVAGGKTQALATGLGQVAMMAGAGGPLGIALAAFAAAMAIINAKMKEQEEAAKRAEEAWTKLHEAHIKARDSAVQALGAAKAELALKGSLGHGGTGDADDRVIQRRAAIGAEIVNLQNALNVATAETAGTIKIALKAKWEEFILVKAIVEEEDRIAAKAKAKAKAEADRAAAIAEQTRLLKEQAALIAALPSGPNKDVTIAALPENTDAQIAHKEEIKFQDRIQRVLEDRARVEADKKRAAEQSLFWELESNKAQQAIVEEEKRVLDARQAQAFAIANSTGLTGASAGFAPDVGSIGAAAVNGGGFSAAGSALGAAGGAAVSMAMGDVSGQSGAAIGGAIGATFGSLIDSMQPLQDLFKALSDVVSKVVEPIGRVIKPLINFMNVIEEVIYRGMRPLGNAWMEVIGTLVEIGLKVATAFLPLINTLVFGGPILQLLLLGLRSVIPSLNLAAKGLDRFVRMMFTMNNRLVDLINKLPGMNLQKVSYDAWYGDESEDGACFTLGTKVATPDGKRPIGELKEGHVVMAAENETGAPVPGVVLQVHVHTVHELLILSLDDGEEIETTEEHPFFVVEADRYVHAGMLEVGQTLRRIDGSGAVVKSAFRITGEFEVRTLTVREHRSFYVGEAGVLVHNDDKKKEALKRAKAEAEAKKALEENTDAVKELTRSQNNMPSGYRTEGREYDSQAAGRSGGNVVFNIGQVQGPNAAILDDLRRMARRGLLVGLAYNSIPDERN